jgi:hypothetical protein
VDVEADDERSAAIEAATQACCDPGACHWEDDDCTPPREEYYVAGDIAECVTPINDEAEQFLRDVMTTAIEGGIDYWAYVRDLERNNDGDVVCFDVRDAEEPEQDRTHIDADAIRGAINRILGNHVKVGRDIVEQFIGFPNDCENTNCDAEGADVVVQIAVYGEIRFS